VPARDALVFACGCAISLCVSLSSCGGGIVVGPTPTNVAVVVGAGDIGPCGAAGGGTGALLDGISGTVMAIGDLAYPDGAAQQFRTCYETAWGRHKSRTRPVPGNHDYDTAGAQPYYDYFGSQAGGAGLGYYSYRAGAWVVLALNSNVPIGRGSEQLAWVSSELRSQTASCTMAYFHHPYVTSGPNGDNPYLNDLWTLLYERDADVVVSAHDHLYERFAPMNAVAQRDPVRGIRQFIVGTGGSDLYPVAFVHAASEMRLSAYGVLKLTLFAGNYEWEFMRVDGSRGDVGAGTCH
jgi:hypothetical protein